MGGVGKEQHRNPVKLEGAVVDLGVAPYVHINLARVKLPVGMGQFASGNGAVIHQVMIGTDLVDDFAGKGERSGRGENHPVGAKAQAGSSDHIVKLSGFQSQVVGTVRGPNVVVVRSAVQGKMSAARSLVGVGVVSRFVGLQYVGFVINLHRSVQFIDVAISLLLDGADRWPVIGLCRKRTAARRSRSGYRFFLGSAARGRRNLGRGRRI